MEFQKIYYPTILVHNCKLVQLDVFELHWIFSSFFFFTDNITTMADSSSSAAKLPKLPLTEEPRPLLKDINHLLTCILCNGYFVDATTIVECLHTCKYYCFKKKWRKYHQIFTSNSSRSSQIADHASWNSSKPPNFAPFATSKCTERNRILVWGKLHNT